MTRDGVRLSHAEDGAGPPVLLVHAGIADRRMWQPQVEPLARRHRVMRCDLRGHGETPLTPGPFAHHRDLAELLEALGAAPAVVVGASMGGAAALDLALSRPELVRGLVLVGSALGGADFTEPALHELWEEAETAFDRGDREEAARIETRTWLGTDDHSLVRSMLLRSYELEADLEDEEEPLEPPAVSRLAEVRAPTLVIAGERDRPDIRRFADVIVAGVPGARRADVPEAFHLPSLERPEELNALLLGFLAELS